jgi:hypothetical protein
MMITWQQPTTFGINWSHISGSSKRVQQMIELNTNKVEHSNRGAQHELHP